MPLTRIVRSSDPPTPPSSRLRHRGHRATVASPPLRLSASRLRRHASTSRSSVQSTRSAYTPSSSVTREQRDPESPADDTQLPSWLHGDKKHRRLGREIWCNLDIIWPAGQGCSPCTRRQRVCKKRNDRKACASCTAQGNARAMCDIARIALPAGAITTLNSTATANASMMGPGSGSTNAVDEIANAFSNDQGRRALASTLSTLVDEIRSLRSQVADLQKLHRRPRPVRLRVWNEEETGSEWGEREEEEEEVELAPA